MLPDLPDHAINAALAYVRSLACAYRKKAVALQSEYYATRATKGERRKYEQARGRMRAIQAQLARLGRRGVPLPGAVDIAVGDAMTDKTGARRLELKASYLDDVFAGALEIVLHLLDGEIVLCASAAEGDAFWRSCARWSAGALPDVAGHPPLESDAQIADQVWQALPENARHAVGELCSILREAACGLDA